MYQHELTIVYICALPLESPSQLPPMPTPLGYYRAPCESLSHTANSHWLYVYVCWCICIHGTLSIHLTLSLFSSTLVHKSVHYVCVSIAALQTDSLVPSF